MLKLLCSTYINQRDLLVEGPLAFKLHWGEHKALCIIHIQCNNNIKFYIICWSVGVVCQERVLILVALTMVERLFTTVASIKLYNKVWHMLINSQAGCMVIIHPITE